MVPVTHVAYPGRGAGTWIQPGPSPAMEAFAGFNQKMEDLCFCVNVECSALCMCECGVLPFKSKESLKEEIEKASVVRAMGQMCIMG